MAFSGQTPTIIVLKEGLKNSFSFSSSFVFLSRTPGFYASFLDKNFALTLMQERMRLKGKVN